MAKVANQRSAEYDYNMDKDTDETLVQRLADVVFSEKDGVSEEEHEQRLHALNDHLKSRRGLPSKPA